MACAPLHAFLRFFIRFLSHPLLYHITITELMESGERKESCCNGYHTELQIYGAPAPLTQNLKKMAHKFSR